MAIIHMMGNFEYDRQSHVSVEVTTFPEGAYCPLDWNDFTKNRPDSLSHLSDMEYRKQQAIVLYTTHHGLCLYEREENGYHDSDFYMVVWNPEKGCTEEVCFATTRGWTYPCYGSYADATPEVLEAYNKWRENMLRYQRVMARWQARKNLRKSAAKANITTMQYKRVQKCYGHNGDLFNRVIKLLTSNLRSQFRKNMAEQLRTWLNDANPKYATPFSRKQLDYI